MGQTVCAYVAGDKFAFETIACDQIRVLRLRPKSRCIHAVHYHRDLFRVDTTFDEVATKGMRYGDDAGGFVVKKQLEPL